MPKLFRFFPLFQDIKGYDRGTFRADALAGLTVGVLLIPQSMAYALLAGMPLIYGLYGALVPLILYGILGSSRHLSIGPVAISAILVLTGISQICEPGSDEYISYVILLGLLIGVLQFALSLLKLGFLTNFISHPVIAGFTSAAAVIIASTQLSDILGITSPGTEGFMDRMVFFVRNVHTLNWPTAMFGLSAFLMLLGFKRVKKAFPVALFVVILGVVISYIIKADVYDVEIIGAIPSGLPAFHVPPMDLETIRLLMPTVLVVTLIGVVESISIAKTLEAKSRSYNVNPDQELLALGISKIGGAFFQALPSSGSFTRSAVNLDSHGRTGMSSIFSALLVIVTLIFFTPMFYYLPKSILAAVILVAIFSLFDYRAFFNLWKIHKEDFWMMVITFIGTLFIGIEMGVLVGVIMSLLAVVYRTSKPHLVVLGNIPGTTYYRNLNRFDELNTSHEIMIIRFDEKLYFGNALYFRDKIKRLVRENHMVRYVLLDSSNISSIDSTGIDVLRELDDTLKEIQIDLHLSSTIGPVRDILFRSGLLTEPDKHHMTIHSGVLEIQKLKKDESDDGKSENWAMQANLKKRKKSK